MSCDSSYVLVSVGAVGRELGETAFKVSALSLAGGDFLVLFPLGAMPVIDQGRLYQISYLIICYVDLEQRKDVLVVRMAG